VEKERDTGFASISFALRVHSAVVKTRASSSMRFRVTVRADGRPSAPNGHKRHRGRLRCFLSPRLLDPLAQLLQRLAPIHDSTQLVLSPWFDVDWAIDAVGDEAALMGPAVQRAELLLIGVVLEGNSRAQDHAGELDPVHRALGFVLI
jgi:hypothetical protein